MKILAIETSCDETAAAVVENGSNVLSNVISSQIAKHAEFGGVIPELAAREHIRNISWVVKAALQQANTSIDEISSIAVTSHPGLLPALAVGTAYAKGLAISSKKPLIAINHFLGHIYGAFLEQSHKLQDLSTYPILSLVVSGGHTAIVLINADGSTTLIGQTIDDAAGEAYDKAAKLLNLGYPGGPIIDRLAKEGKACYSLPRALTGENGKAVKDELQYCFSFSGVKTALLYTVKNIIASKGHDLNTLAIEEEAALLTDEEIKNLAASFQEAVVDVLVTKCLKAAKHFKVKTSVICGGVACNSVLRERFANAMSKIKVQTVIAPPKYCTDNAAMIGGLAYHYAKKGDFSDHNFDIMSRAHSIPSLPFTKMEQNL